MEIWDIYDENRQLTGNTIVRGHDLKKGEFHLVVDIWIKNSKNEYLIAKRTANKTFPLMWHTVGGSATAGESSTEAALREVKEEIGIALNILNGKLVHSLKRENSYKDIYLFEQDININNVVYQQDETCGAMWATKEKILDMIKEGTFVSVYGYLDIIFKD